MTFIKRMKEERLEGDIIKRQTKEALLKAQREELQRKINQGKTREELKKANEDLKAYTAEIKRKEQLELNRINEYARKKDANDQLKKDKEEQRFVLKQAVRNTMIEKQA